MRLLFVCILGIGLTVPASSAADTFGADQVVLQSLQQTSNGPSKTLEGKVRIETRDVIIQADKATFNSDTLEIQPVGHVVITLKRP